MQQFLSSIFLFFFTALRTLWSKVGPSLLTRVWKKCVHDYNNKYIRFSYGNMDTYRKCSRSCCSKSWNSILIWKYQNYYRRPCYAIKPMTCFVFNIPINMYNIGQKCGTSDLKCQWNSDRYGTFQMRLVMFTNVSYVYIMHWSDPPVDTYVVRILDMSWIPENSLLVHLHTSTQMFVFILGQIRVTCLYILCVCNPFTLSQSRQIKILMARHPFKNPLKALVTFQATFDTLNTKNINKTSTDIICKSIKKCFQGNPCFYILPCSSPAPRLWVLAIYLDTTDYIQVHTQCKKKLFFLPLSSLFLHSVIEYHRRRHSCCPRSLEDKKGQMSLLSHFLSHFYTSFNKDRKH